MSPRLIPLLYFGSGACCLVYELALARIFALSFGQTSLISAFVIAGTLAGSGAGALYWAGRLHSFGSGARAYAVLSAGGALAAGAALLGGRLAGSLPLPLEPIWLRSCLSSTLVFALSSFPAFLTGGTLPAVARALGPDRVAGLYAVNTWGAAIGVLLAGFVVVPYLGHVAALALAALLHLLLAAAALRMGPADVLDPPEPPAAGFGKGGDALILGVAALSGAALLSAEVYWLRALSLVVGSTTYAFSAVLAAFLAGLAVGGVLASRLSGWSPRSSLTIVLLGAAALAPLLSSLFDWFPILFLALHAWTGHVIWAVHAGALAMAMLALLPLTTLLGASFPLACSLFGRGPTGVGRVAAWNLLGSVAGAVLTPLIVIPVAGLAYGGCAAAILCAGGAILLAWEQSNPAMRRLALAGALIPAGLLLALPIPRDAVALSGVHTYANRFIQASGGRVQPSVWRRLLDDWDVLFRKDGRHFTVGVMRNPTGDVVLSVDGKTDASNSPVDMPTQILLGHLGPLLHPGAPKSAVLIGLGSGVSLNTLLMHPELREVRAVEVEPAVVEASRFFKPFGGGVPEDPRARVVVDDARQVLRHLDEPVDLIVSEPSNPWMAGVSHLFTREFYSLARRRLKPQGLVVQWLHFYLMSPDDFRLALRTFTEVFPHSSLWWTAAGDVLLVGGEQPLHVPLEDLKKRLAAPVVAASLRRIGLDQPYTLLAHCILSGQSLREYVGAGPLHTDGHPRLEFSLPATLFHAEFAGMNRAFLFGAARPPVELLRGEPDLLDLAEASIAATNWAAARILLDGYAAKHPNDARGWRLVARLWLAAGQAQNALAALKTAARLAPNDAGVRHTLSQVYLRLGDHGEALRAAKRAHALEPNAALHLNQLGLILRAMRRHPESVEAFRAALKHPDAAVESSTYLAATHLDSGELRDAEVMLRQATETNMNYAPLHYTWGRFFLMRGDFSLAQLAFQKAVAMNPELRPMVSALLQKGEAR